MTDLRQGAPTLLILGAGGHARVVVEALRAAGFPPPLGCLADVEDRGVPGVPRLGGLDELRRLRADGLGHAVVAIGDNAARAVLGARLAALGFALPAIVHPAAYLSPSAVVGDGAVVLARACLGTEARLGWLAILNTNAVLDHDGEVEEAAHVAPGCALAGGVRVGARALIGVGSAVRPGIVIGADAVVGAGSAVVRDVPPGGRVAGCPARPLTPGSS